jgi:4-hydroxyphenylpyruvate dioxygenase
MRKSIATVSLSGTLEEKLSAAALVGFDGVELFESDLISCALSPGQIRERAADLGLRIELYQPFRDFEGVGPDMLVRNLRRAEGKFQVMSELGVDLLLVCSNVSPTTVDNDELAADQLGQLADRAAQHGLRIAYEALAWGRRVADYRRAWGIVAAGNRSNLGLCLDSFHILSRRDDPAGIADIPAAKIFFLQLADAPDMQLDLLQWSRHFRCFPGQGSFDLETFTAAVITAGYRGPLSVEVFNDVFRQADARRTATDALRSLIALEESLRRRLARDGADAPTVSDRPELAAPADPVELTGYSFVEIAVDAFAEEAASQLLRCLDFRLVGRHRSKPVQLWQQGRARILLNRDAPPGQGWLRGDAQVSAVAVETNDPRRSAVRSQQLLAPAIPRRYGPGEADLFATEAPDRTSVFFCRTDPADPDSWLSDFEPLADNGPLWIEGPAGGNAIGRVDHVGLSLPAICFDEAALFYQSVLGLRRSASEEVADPYGLVRSRAVSTVDGRVRLVLMVPPLAGARGAGVSGFQHVAFGSSNVFVAARRMRTLGLPVLPVPDNYYRDLAARTELAGPLIDRMRSASILYDRDPDGGEFFHFFTAMLGRRMFFEVVQRLHDYDGYATVNMPVRMAAQYRQGMLAPIIG